MGASCSAWLFSCCTLLALFDKGMSGQHKHWHSLWLLVLRCAAESNVAVVSDIVWCGMTGSQRNALKPQQMWSSNACMKTQTCDRQLVRS